MQRFPWHRLRWKLTLSYALVTTGGLLTVVLMATGVMFWALEPTDLAHVLLPPLRYAAPSLALALEAPSAELHAWLRVLVREQRVPLSLEATDEGLKMDLLPAHIAGAVVTDAQGRIVAQEPTDFCPATTVAECWPQVLAPLLPLQGATARPQTRQVPQGLLLVLPIARPQEQPKGALMVLLAWPRGLAEWWQVLREAFPLAAVAAVVGFSLFLGAVFGYATARSLTRRLDALGRASDAWSRGDFSVVVRDAADDELGLLARRLNAMAEQLHDLLQTRTGLAALAERHRLARELHDAVKQLVFSAEMQLAAAAQHLAQARLPQAQNALHEAQDLLQQTQRELRALIHELRPAPQPNLLAALRAHLQRWEQQTGIPVHFQPEVATPPPPEVTHPLLRVVQEALTNVARHSQARQVWVQLHIDGAGLRLVIQDDGQGFDFARRHHRGFGLLSMQERIAALGGTFQVHSAVGQGTEVRITIPMGGRHEPDVR